MQSTTHGEHLGVAEALQERASRTRRAGPQALGADAGETSTGFGVMFEGLRKAEHQLAPTKDVIDGLDALANAMIDPGPEAAVAGAQIKTAFTYFGQFLDHDITKQGDSTDAALLALPGNPSPAPVDDLFSKLVNARTGRLDLDSLYQRQDDQMPPPPRDPTNDHKMALGVCSPAGGPPGSKSAKDNDHKRELGVAQIGDPRNDENLVVGQLHVAFLRAHNASVDQGHDFTSAQRRIRRAFQNIVLEDFLPKVCDPAIVADVVQNKRKFWNPKGVHASDLPIEFSVAAYRFGHSMIRANYNYNRKFPTASLEQLFFFTHLTGVFDTVPENWIAEWQGFFEEDARPIDARLTTGLKELPKETNALLKRLAARNLMRGFLFGLPTGQAIAATMNVPALSEAQVRASLPNDTASQDAITKAGFHLKTPLWFYVLAEAGAQTGASKGRLGPVGGRIVAETLHALIEASEDSILTQPPAADEKLDLKGLLKLSDPLN